MRDFNRTLTVPAGIFTRTALPILIGAGTAGQGVGRGHIHAKAICQADGATGAAVGGLIAGEAGGVAFGDGLFVGVVAGLGADGGRQGEPKQKVG